MSRFSPFDLAPSSARVLVSCALVACGEPAESRGGGGTSASAGGAAAVAGHGGHHEGGTAVTPVGGVDNGGAAAASGRAPMGGDEPGGGMAGTAPLAGAGGAAGSNSSGGTAGAGGGAAGAGGSVAAPAICPEGPFPAPMVMGTKNVCSSFDFTYSWNEGPTWVERQKAFFFSNFVAGSASGGNIIKYTPGGNCEVYIRDVGCNGLAASNDGNLLAACQQTRSVVRFDLTTKQATPLAERYMGMLLDTPNDLIQHSNGSIYFTNPTNELAGRAVGVGPAAFRIDPNGELSLIRTGNSNGIGLSPDEKKLYVLLLGRWDLDAQGVPSNQQSMFSTGDGMAVDCAGNVYTNGSIFTSAGQNIGSWGTGTNLAFGGPDRKTVLVTGPGKQLRELTLNVPGLP